MCAFQKRSGTFDPARLIRPQTRLDIILNLDPITGQADVRNSLILDVAPDSIIAAQSDPPILRSMTDAPIEATVIHHDRLNYETTRWGWNTRILGLRNDYRLNAKDPESALAAVVFIGLPGKNGLRRANIRQAYRIDLTSRDNVSIEISPSLAPVSLLNFSAGGAMIATPAPPAYKLGEAVKFGLIFPEGPRIDGDALVVRMEYEPGENKAKLGLKFEELNVNNSRILNKLLNEYMLAEQRRRNRDA
jgi:PilZ domain.